MASSSCSEVPTLVSSLPDLEAFLASIPPSGTCTLCMDLEGKNLSRNGTLSLLTVLIHPSRASYLIDVQTLGDSAFTTPSPDSDGKTLKAVLEDRSTPKYLWDVRNDADALWAHHQVRLAGVIDVQLLENASRAGDKTYLHGLDKSVDRDLSALTFTEWERWAQTKKGVKALMSTDVFTRRPLDVTTMQYCINDVIYLPALHDVYAKRITSEWLEKAMDESAQRVVEACEPAYEPQSDEKRYGPWGSGMGCWVLEPWVERWEQGDMTATAYDDLASSTGWGQASSARNDDFDRW